MKAPQEQTSFPSPQRSYLPPLPPKDPTLSLPRPSFVPLVVHQRDCIRLLEDENLRLQKQLKELLAERQAVQIERQLAEMVRDIISEE